MAAFLIGSTSAAPGCNSGNKGVSEDSDSHSASEDTGAGDGDSDADGDADADTDGDADADGDVDGFDFLVWQFQFGSDVGNRAATAVPEPTSAGLLMAVLATVGCFWRTSRDEHSPGC